MGCFSQKTFVDIDTYLYFDFFRSFLSLSWLGHSKSIYWSIKQEQESKPCSSSAKRESAFPVCESNRGSGIQSRSMLLTSSTQLGRRWFYDFQRSLKYRACRLLNKQRCSFLSNTGSPRVKNIFLMHISMSVLLLHLTRFKDTCSSLCTLYNRCLWGKPKWPHMC